MVAENGEDDFRNWQSVEDCKLKKFKISNRDYYLLAGFIASCIAIMILSWCLG